jgi:uncharacterized membrane protein
MIRKLVKFVLFVTVIFNLILIPFIIVLPADPIVMPFGVFALITSLVGYAILLKENRYQRIIGRLR